VALALCLGPGQRRQQERGENGNDSNDDQQFNQREPHSLNIRCSEFSSASIGLRLGGFEKDHQLLR
jgi:hypothetical protein